MMSAAGALVAGLVVGIANNLLNNLPLGLVAGNTLKVAHVQGLVANAASRCGPGPKPFGHGLACNPSLAHGPAKGKIEVSFWKFLKVGAVVMPAALLFLIGGAILMHTLFHTK